MFDSLNKFGLPTKYGVMGFVGGIIWAALSQALEMNDGGTSYYLGYPIAGTIGGAIGGWLRQRSGKQN